MDENMNDLEDENGTGELLVRSPSLMTGYLDNPEATNNSFVNGWLRTGDIAYQRDGKWYIVDRTKVFSIWFGPTTVCLYIHF